MVNHDKYYKNVTSDLYRKLREFRKSYPYKKVEIDDRQWQYIDTEKGENVVVFLSGATGTGETNINSLFRYKDNFRIISPSYPPLGSFDELVKGVLRILEIEAVKKTHLIGGSLGAGVGHVIIRRNPQLVDKFVIMAFGLPDGEQVRTLKKFLRTLSMVPYNMLKKGMLKDIKRIYSEKPDGEIEFMTAFFYDLLENQLNKKIIKGHFAMALDMAETGKDLSMFEPVNGKNRVLIMQASDDESFNEAQREALFISYPGAEIRVFESGGHAFPMSREKEVNTIIENFLNVG